MGFYAGCLKQFEIVNGGFQVLSADAFDCQAYRVFTGIEFSVFSGAVILEFQQNVAVSS